MTDAPGATLGDVMQVKPSGQPHMSGQQFSPPADAMMADDVIAVLVRQRDHALNSVVQAEAALAGYRRLAEARVAALSRRIADLEATAAGCVEQTRE